MRLLEDDMSRFYGSLTGQAKTTATRRGSTNSNVMAHVRGWDFGVRTVVCPCNVCGADCVWIELTGGSNDESTHRILNIICSNGCSMPGATE